MVGLVLAVLFVVVLWSCVTDRIIKIQLFSSVDKVDTSGIDPEKVDIYDVVGCSFLWASVIFCSVL